MMNILIIKKEIISANIPDTIVHQIPSVNAMHEVQLDSMKKES